MMWIDPFERFLFRCHKYPDAHAIVIGGNSLTYENLLKLTMRIATAIASPNESPRVAIFLPKSAEAYAGMFATLSVGGFYVPLNVDAPVSRNAKIVAEFAPDFTITSRDFEAEARESGLTGEIVLVEELPFAKPMAPLRGELAYVIFTSGSTGTPKGVVISRKALSHYIDWIEKRFSIQSGDRWSQHPNIGFDLSVLDIYGALTLGATLYPMVTARHLLMPAIFIRENAITIWNSVPSVIDLMSKARQLNAENLASLRLATFCGEPLLARHVEGLHAANADLVVQNTYGPTEATVSCSEIILSRDRVYSGSIEIGSPIEGMSFYVAQSGRVIPLTDECEEGELLIVGPQLAEGYWNDPDRTAQSFGDYIVDGLPIRAYRTGDRIAARNGQIAFRGRIDDQVKIRGYRLELDEVDVAASSLGIGITCTVKAGDELHCFFETGASLDLEDIVARLKIRLPDHAVPARFHALAQLPRNANDKLDRKALRALIENKQFGDERE